MFFVEFDLENVQNIKKMLQKFFSLDYCEKKSQKKYKFENNLIFDINEINFNLILDSLTNF